jgi:hypothetical protein
VRLIAVIDRAARKQRQSARLFVQVDNFQTADHPGTGGVCGQGAFLGIGRTESLCLKRGNHFVENALSKAFIKRSVTLQPSEEQGATKHIDQQFCIGRRFQFA